MSIYPRQVVERFSPNEHVLVAVGLADDDPPAVELIVQLRDRAPEDRELFLAGSKIRFDGDLVLDQKVYLELAEARALAETIAAAVTFLEAAAGSDPSGGPRTDPAAGPPEAPELSSSSGEEPVA